MTDAELPDVPEHYFTGGPATAAERRTVTVRLAGRDVEVEVASGVFSPGRVDLGTQVLLRAAPTPPSTGRLLDLGCGWGPLALTLATESPEATVWAVDVSERALDLTRRNAQRLGLANLRTARPGPGGVPDDVTFTAIWSNPPIRVGKDVLHDMLRTWLARLAPSSGDADGAWLVVQRNLGADSLARWIEAELGESLGVRVERAASAKGYRVLRVTR
ncbi:class I SAM-dependent methyltransferase [Xylanimonas ulmi]|uniref:16S rRNA m(2)G 1207 methyltransferase n=1 Tax=Xylanimonas ulmi TaxID=228973 RepID=A0A4Q7M0N5_9MICO|nr:methyltransferase [Xylanibacterium ulmi]RZS61325.1 16S rRNA m(2)G 1207 methyltransferase [Xylanibacterium ulmi]